MTSWNDLLTFINGRVEGFAATARGVGSADVPKGMPSLYAAFLESMGRGSPAIRAPFGAGQNYDFDALQKLGNPYRGFHRVSFETDTAMEPVFDHYLDLERATAADAPLVMIERGADLNDPGPIDVGFSFGEFVASQVFIRLGLERTKTETTLLVMHLEPDVAQARLLDAVAALTAIDVRPAFEPMPRLAGLTDADGTLAVRVAVHEVTSVLNVRVGGNDPVAIETAIAALRLALPTIRRRSPSGQFEMSVAQ